MQRNDRLAFPRRSRLARKAEIDRVRREGRRIRTDSLDVRTLTSPLSYPRVGIIVPRFGHSIVERNKVRRRLRELVRTYLLPILPPHDVLLRAVPRAYSRTFAALESEVRQLGAQLGGQPAQ